MVSRLGASNRVVRLEQTIFWGEKRFFGVACGLELGLEAHEAGVAEHFNGSFGVANGKGLGAADLAIRTAWPHRASPV